MSVDLLGPLAVDADYATVPMNVSGDAFVVAGNGEGTAARSIAFASPPSGDIVAVAAYDDGIVFHDPTTLGATSVLGIRGAPAGLDIASDGRLGTADTTVGGVDLVARDPWHIRLIDGVSLVDDVAFARDGTLYATQRDPQGHGVVSAVARDGTVRSLDVGQTPEGIAVSHDGSRVYTANTNDGTISLIDARAMREVARVHVVDRVFSLQLSADDRTLYATSNQSSTSLFARPGSVVAVDARTLALRARSAPLEFPLGIASDPSSHRLFVTDESASIVDVLDDRTLRATQPPLRTCRTPWQPHVDAIAGRLYVPCAREDRLDVYALRTLKRISGAPFLTGRYPLAVATWHREVRSVRY